MYCIINKYILYSFLIIFSGWPIIFGFSKIGYILLINILKQIKLLLCLDNMVNTSIAYILSYNISKTSRIDNIFNVIEH